MKIKWVSRHDENEELDKLYKKILKRENRKHIAKETKYTAKKQSMFKKISLGKLSDKPSKLKEKYKGSWLNSQVDEIKDDLSDFLLSASYYMKKSKFFFMDLKEFIVNNFFVFVSTLSVIFLIGVGLFTYRHMFGYEVTFNGVKLGVVKNIDDFESVLNNVDSDLSGWYGNSNIYYEKSISYKKVPIKKQSDVLNEKECEKEIYALKLPLYCKGAVITVDGKEALRVGSEAEAKTVINNLGAKYEKENSNEQLISSGKTEEKVKYKTKLIDIASVVDTNTAVNYLTNNDADVSSINSSSSSDTKNSLSESNGNTNLVSALNFRDDDFSVDQITEKPTITIKTVKKVTYSKKVPFKTIYKDSSDLYVGTKKVAQKGQQGKKRVTAINTYENGIVTNSDIQKETLVEEPTVEIVSRGAKPSPPVSSSGKFIMPASGQISALNKAGSHAGYKAVDIAGPTGTKIYASDTGIVTRASWYSGYGNCVDIDHGNGYSTRYGHNSKILVRVGQKVQQGEVIALMGSTGNSTGPHCHFEISFNGQRQIILNFFKYLRNGLMVQGLQK